MNFLCFQISNRASAMLVGSKFTGTNASFRAKRVKARKPCIRLSMQVLLSTTPAIQIASDGVFWLNFRIASAQAGT
eukprot:Skav206787  [mRNA]  locus=scaffold1990:27182:28201:+ [translate_table: standard]